MVKAIINLYRIILDWHRINNKEIFKRRRRGIDDPYVRCYLKIIDKFPQPGIANVYDIACLAAEQVAGLLEWAAPEKIDDRSLFQLGREIVDHLGGWSKTLELAKQSVICKEYGMLTCLEKERKSRVL